MRVLATIAGLILFAAVMGWVGTADVEEEKRQQESYCEMVEIWDESGGEYGWPPYDGREGCQK